MRDKFLKFINVNDGNVSFIHIDNVISIDLNKQDNKLDIITKGSNNITEFKLVDQHQVKRFEYLMLYGDDTLCMEPAFNVLWRSVHYV